MIERLLHHCLLLQPLRHHLFFPDRVERVIIRGKKEIGGLGFRSRGLERKRKNLKILKFGGGEGGGESEKEKQKENLEE